MKKNELRNIVIGCLGMGAIGIAEAGVIALDFEDVAPYPNDNNVFIEQFYNGGTASNGNSGVDYGVVFPDGAAVLCLNSTAVFCSNTSRGGLAPESAEGGLIFLSNLDWNVNVAAGFDAGFALNYVSESVTGSVSIFDGLNGTGNLLASLELTPNAGTCTAYDAGFCPFSAAGVAFDGTARSVSFDDAGIFIAFDDLTFGSARPGAAVPGPATMSLFLLGLAGLLRRRPIPAR